MFIYQITEKPECYKRVKNPPKTTWEKLCNSQDTRQQGFNNFCIRFGVYCGSYLPDNPDLLL